MDSFKEGDVVICGTGQSGCIIQIDVDIWILLKNYDVWVGSKHHVRFPQDQADLDACPLNVERTEKSVPRPDVID